MSLIQQPLTGMEQIAKRESPITSMTLLDKLADKEGAIEAFKAIVDLRREEMARESEMAFNEAMNAVQAELGRIAPDLTNPQTRSRYASYAQLDKAIRPAYTKHGFSLSFNTDKTAPEGTVGVSCYVSHREGHTREYNAILPVVTTGPQGKEFMTKTHATGAAMSYGMRYLLKMIFNLAIGEEDDDGNNLSNGWLAERVEWIENCRNLDELKKVFAAAYNEASEQKNNRAMAALIVAKDKKKAEL